MKTRSHFYSKCCLALWSLLLVVGAQAQPAPTAKYDPVTKVIALDEKAAFGYVFQLDLTPLKFSSQAAAEEFFGNWTTELVSFRVHFEEHTANVLLYTRLRPTWLAKEWNAYLAQLPKQ